MTDDLAKLLTPRDLIPAGELVPAGGLILAKPLIAAEPPVLPAQLVTPLQLVPALLFFGKMRPPKAALTYAPCKRNRHREYLLAIVQVSFVVTGEMNR
jgi:hypothetical protein